MHVKLVAACQRYGIRRTAPILLSIVAADERYGIVTDAEQIIGQIAEALDVIGVTVPQVTRLPAARSLHSGMRICFTGIAVHAGNPVSRSLLEETAALAGMQPVEWVTKKSCDLLRRGIFSRNSVYGCVIKHPYCASRPCRLAEWITSLGIRSRISTRRWRFLLFYFPARAIVRRVEVPGVYRIVEVPNWTRTQNPDCY